MSSLLIIILFIFIQYIRCQDLVFANTVSLPMVHSIPYKVLNQCDFSYLNRYADMVIVRYIVPIQKILGAMKNFGLVDMVN